MSPKEQNLIIRAIKTDTVDYTEFGELLYKIRFTIAHNQIMSTEKESLEEIVFTEFRGHDE